MLSLHLFGGLSLTSSEDQVPLRAGQRRRLAVLAVLAVSRRRPVGRGKLVALLWPDADPDHGRRLLADSIYVLRDSLGEDLLLTTGDNVSLNPSRVASDVGDFADALDRRDFAHAVSVYSGKGPFLDGVHLPEAAEFERWADATSRQLVGDYRRALEELAKAAVSRGNHQEAVEWWRRLAADDRASSRVALELMRALEASGDIAGAIEFAGVHEKIVKAEIDAPPDPSVIAFADELRRRSKSIKKPSGTTAQEATESAPTETLVMVREAPLSAMPISASPVPAPIVSAASNGETAVAHGPRWRHRKLVWSLVIVALVMVGYAAFRALTRPNIVRDMRGRGPSIVVLPLRSVTSGADNESFADGMTEGLIASLSKISRLRVIASTSAFAFKGHSTDVRVIADSLHVSNVLEGSVQRSGSRLRLSIRMVDAADGSTRWSETYDRDVKDFFAVEDEIGRAVAGHLSLLLGGGSVSQSRHQTTVIKAYDLYLRGRHQRELRSDTAFKAAIGYFNQAIAADSNYAAAHAALSEACATLAFSTNTAEFPRAKLLACGETGASRALELDDSLSAAHVALGFLRLLGHHIDLSAAEKELKRALELDSANRQAHEYLAIVFDETNRPDLGMAEARRAEALDPLSVTAIREMGRALYSARRYDEALIQLNRARSMGPPVRNVPVIAAQVYAKKGMLSQAIAELQHPRSSFGQALLGHMYALAGNKTEASRILAQLITQFESGTGSAFDVAVVYVGLRDYDNAFRWLEKSFEDSSIRANIMDPLFDDLRADPRFRPMRSRLGLQKV